MHKSKDTAHTIVVVLINKKRVVCAHLGPGFYKRCRLNAVQETEHAPIIATSNVLLQTQVIGTSIQQFLTKNRYQNQHILFILDEPIIAQGYATTVNASAQAYLLENLAMPHTRINTLYLYPYEERFLHWWSRCHYALLLQLQLLAQTYQLNIIGAVSPFPALFALYKTIRGTGYHPLQYASDLAQHNYDMAACIDYQVLTQLVEGLPASLDHTIATTLVAAALYEL